MEVCRKVESTEKTCLRNGVDKDIEKVQRKYKGVQIIYKNKIWLLLGLKNKSITEY